jgi:hypothetical protein
MADVQFQQLVQAIYSPVLAVPDDGDGWTKEKAINVLTALANRIEYALTFVPEASKDPSAFCVIQDDFLGADSFIDTDHVTSERRWLKFDTGSPFYAMACVSTDHPGEFITSVAAGENSILAAGLTVGDNWIDFQTFDQMVIIAKNGIAGGTTGQAWGAGIASSWASSLLPTDGIMVRRLTSASASWQLIVRKAGSTTQTITLGAFVNSEFIVVRLSRTSAGDLDVFFNGEAAGTVLLADQPLAGVAGQFARYIGCAGGGDAFGDAIDFLHLRIPTPTSARKGV